jgi:hypothetical protein
MFHRVGFTELTSICLLSFLCYHSIEIDCMETQSMQQLMIGPRVQSEVIYTLSSSWYDFKPFNNNVHPHVTLGINWWNWDHNTLKNQYLLLQLLCHVLDLHLMMVWNFLQSSAKCIITFCCTSRLLSANTYHAQWMMICELQTLFHCIPVQYINLPSNQPEWTSNPPMHWLRKTHYGFHSVKPNWRLVLGWFRRKKKKKAPLLRIIFPHLFSFFFFSPLPIYWPYLSLNPPTY